MPIRLEMLGDDLVKQLPPPDELVEEEDGSQEQEAQEDIPDDSYNSFVE